MNITVKLTNDEIAELIRKHVKETFGEGAEVSDDSFGVQDDMGKTVFGFTVEVDVVLNKPKPVAATPVYGVIAGELIQVGGWPADDMYHGLGDRRDYVHH